MRKRGPILTVIAIAVSVLIVVVLHITGVIGASIHQ
jgi:hypothetical protein